MTDSQHKQDNPTPAQIAQAFRNAELLSKIPNTLKAVAASQIYGVNVTPEEIASGKVIIGEVSDEPAYSGNLPSPKTPEKPNNTHIMGHPAHMR